MHRLIMLSAGVPAIEHRRPGDRAGPIPRTCSLAGRIASGWIPNLCAMRCSRRRGQLDATLGGPAVADIASPRRTLYLRTVRSDRATYRMLFDAADPQLAVDKRTESTVAPQALFLLNSPFAKAQAKALAALAQQQPGDLHGKVDWLYRRLYARRPTADETKLGVAAIGRWSGARATEAMEAYVHVLLCANELMYVD